MKKIIVWFGIFGSVASILSLLYIFIPRDELIKLEVIQTDKENLTLDYEKREPDLKANYTYKGTEVKNLWKYNFKLNNNSPKTIIGTSSQKNILTDYLTLKLKKGYELLDYKELSSNFSHKMSSDSTSINIAFEQWRPNEKLEYSYYIRSKLKNPAEIPFSDLDFRQIVDGDIVFSIESMETEDKRILSFIPPKGMQAGYVISMIFIGLFIILFTIIIVVAPYAYYNMKRWHKKYFADFVVFINKKFPDNKENQKRYIDKPENLPSRYWKEFKGQSYPNLLVDFNVNKFYSFVLVLTIFVLLNVSLIITFIDLISFFP